MPISQPVSSQDFTLSALDGGDEATLPTADAPASPRQVRLVACGALACGVAADSMFDQGLAGVGLAAYLLAVLLAASGVLRARIQPRHPGDPNAVQSRLLIGIAAVFAVLLSLRSQETIAVFNVLAVLGATALAVATLPGTELNLFALRMRDLAFAAIENGLNAAFGALRFLYRDGTKLFRPNSASAVDGVLAGAIGRAMLLGGTLTLVFGMLLAAGDPLFRHVMTPLVDWNAPVLARHVFTIGFFTWPVLGLLASLRRIAPDDQARSIGVRVARFVSPDGAQALPAFTLNKLDALVILGAMNSLFTLFMLLQLRALFGGQAYVTSTTGLTLAEYARGGFFALAFTAALTIGLLLAVDGLLRSESLAGWRVSQALSASLLALVGVMLCSAVTRMMLYVGEFGISVDRIVALAIMAWLAGVSAWFAATVLRGRPSRFVVGALGMGAVTLMALNAMNIDAIVVRSGVARVAAGRALDVPYMTGTLSADAVPALVRAVLENHVEPAVPGVGAGRTPWSGTTSTTTETTATTTTTATVATNNFNTTCAAATFLLQRWGPDTETRAKAWTFGAWRAREVVAKNASALRARACPVVEVAPAARILQ